MKNSEEVKGGRMKKKTIIISIITFTALLLFGCNNAEKDSADHKSKDAGTQSKSIQVSTDFSENDIANQAFYDMKYDVPSSWESKTNGDGTIVYYYPPSGQINGNTESMLSIQYLESKNAHVDPGKSIETVISNMVKSGEVSIESPKDISVDDSYAKQARYSQVIDGKDYKGDAVLFTVPDAVMCFILFSSDDASTDYSKDFAKIIDSIQLPSPDFFDSSENKQQASDLLYQGNISELSEFLQRYIEENSPPESDSAYHISEIIAPLEGIKEKLYLDTDEFNNQYKLYYNGLTDISADAYILPYSTRGSMELKVGFVGSDWIFMNNAILKYGEGENDTSYISCDSWDGTQEVLGDGSVYEEGNGRIYESEDLEKIVANPENEWTIRLYGKDDKTLDHTLTEAEKDALTTFSIFFKAVSDFDELSKNYK